MTQHKIGLLFAVVVIAAAVWVAMFMGGREDVARITAISYNPYSISIEKGGKQETVPVTPSTKIYQTASQTRPDGSEREIKSQEISISDLAVGMRVRVAPELLQGGVLGQDEILVSDTEFAAPVPLILRPMTGKISAVDLKKGELKVQFTDVLGKTLPIVTVPLLETNPLFAVDDIKRAYILHARTIARTSDLKVGQPIVTEVAASPADGEGTRLTIIIQK